MRPASEPGAARHLAVFNIATLIAPEGDPRVQAFFDGVDRLNAIAARSPGFVWQFHGDGQDAAMLDYDSTGLTIPQLSVWETAQDLANFVWNTLHRQYFQRAKEWFEPLGDLPYLVFWWVAPGHIPNCAEGLDKLDQLRRDGPVLEIFGWERFRTEGLIPGRQPVGAS
ncbi:MAG: DUF3291 domain-containing protein [Pseudomonadota bacterium]